MGLLLCGGNVTISLGMINDTLTNERFEVRVGRVTVLHEVGVGNGRKGRLGVLDLMVGVVWI